MSHYRPYPAYKDSGVEWLGPVPEHWVQVPLKRLVRSIEQGWSPECESWPAEEGGWGVVKVGCVNGGRFRPEENKALPASLEPRPELGLLEGDVLVSRANTRELVGSCVAVPQSYPNLLLCDKIYRIRCGELVTPSFLAALITVHGRRAVEVEATGASSSMLNISQSVILDLPVALPEPAEQDQIMAAASRETARLDALVAKKTRFIELLREKRQALITQVVTKGLDPDVKMKDSGVEWLGQVPEHWETMSLARVTVARCDGPFGSAIKSENYTDSGVRVIRLQNIGLGEFKDGDQAFLSPEYRTGVIGHSHDVEPGDLLIAGLGDENNPLGRTCVAPGSLGDAIVKADCYRFRIDGSRALPAFLALQLSATARVECGFISTGSTRERLNLGLAASRVIALPPSTDEQSAIVERASMVTARLDVLLSKTERSIELLKERRAALITAVVTGQIDLREAS